MDRFFASKCRECVLRTLCALLMLLALLLPACGRQESQPVFFSLLFEHLMPGAAQEATMGEAQYR